MKKLVLAFLGIMSFVFLLSVSLHAEEKKGSGGSQPAKTTTNDLQDKIAINQIKMLFYNNGAGSYDRAGTGSSGLFWPGGDQAKLTAIFADGLIFGAKVGSEIRVGGATYRNGLQAGPILESGLAANPNDSKYKIYKIRKGWETTSGSLRARLEADYNNWPILEGAPYEDVNNDGKPTVGVDKPKFLGDEVNYFVMNDMDPARTTNLYGMQPMGMEVQCSIFGFNKTGPLGDMVFKKYVLINKGSKTLRDMYVAYWSDPDLGNANDDYVGCDTIRKLGYVYNGDLDDDGYYGSEPPAAGYVFFQGPIVSANHPVIVAKGLPDSAKFDWKWRKGMSNLPMTTFAFYINRSSVYQDPELGVPAGSEQMYNYMTGLLWNGTRFIDPNTGLPAQYCLSGDPITGTGWYEGNGWAGGPAPEDRRLVMASGPFTMAPKDTQEVVVGIVLAKGSAGTGLPFNLASIRALKSAVEKAQTAYNYNFNLVANPQTPKMSVTALDEKVVLHWEDNAEAYYEKDPLIPDSVDQYYRFEGYEIYQYSDMVKSNPVLLGTYDKKNGVKEITEFTSINGVLVPTVAANGTDTGLVRHFEIKMDQYTNTALVNGNPYYFGVVAYGYNKNGDQKVLRSIGSPIEVFPTSTPVGDEYTYTYGSSFPVTKSGKSSDAAVGTFVVDPMKLTGHEYEVFVTKLTSASNADSLVWNLRNVTRGDTLLKNRPFDPLPEVDYDYLTDAVVTEGFVVKVSNPASGANKIKEVIMTANAGQPVNPSGNAAFMVPREGVNVFGKSSTTASRNWWIDCVDSVDNSPASAGLEGFNFQYKNKPLGIGNSDIEIRFESDTNKYSAFYPYIMKSSPPARTYKTASSYRGKNKLPLSVWQINDPSSPTDDRRLYLRMFDGKFIGQVFDTSLKKVTQFNLVDSMYNGPRWINRARLAKDSTAIEEILVMSPLKQTPADTIYDETLPLPIRATTDNDYRTKFTILSKTLEDYPKPGTIIRISLWKSLSTESKFTFKAIKPQVNNAAIAKNNLDRISVFPNPYFAAHALEIDKYDRFVRFTNLPSTCTIRIFTIAGVFVRKITREGATSPFEDWNLLNENRVPVASGMFLAHIDIPGVGSKILKIAIIQETPYLDRL